MLELITPVTRAENRKPSDEEILNYFYNFINFLTEHRHLSIETDCHVAGGDKNVSTSTFDILRECGHCPCPGPGRRQWSR